MAGGMAGGAIGGGIGSIFDDMNALDARNRAQQILSKEKDNLQTQMNWDAFDVTQAAAPMTLPDGTSITYDPNGGGWSTQLSAPLQGNLTGGESQVDPYSLAGVQGDTSNAALQGLGQKYRDVTNDAVTGAMRQGFGSTSTSPILAAMAQRQGQDVASTLANTRANSYGTYNSAEQGFNQNRYAPLTASLGAQSPILNAMQSRSSGINTAVTGGGSAANGGANALNGGLTGFNKAQDQSKDAYSGIGSSIGSIIGGFI